MTGLAKQLCPGVHPDRAEKWQDNGAEKIKLLFSEKTNSEIFLTTHPIVCQVESWTEETK